MTSIEVNSIAQEFYTSLYRFAVSLTRETHLAADLTQQAFLMLTRQADKIRDPLRAKGWLKTTLYRDFLQFRRRDALWASEDAAPALASNETLPGDEFGVQEITAVQLGIEALDPIYRDALRLRYLDSLDYKTIAIRLEIPIGTVMSRLSRARSLLARDLRKTSRELAESFGG